MCFGCGDGCGQCTGSMVYIMEKLASFAALTAVVTCIIATVAISLGLGIGLGYNYCFVDLRVMTEKPESNPNILRGTDSGSYEEPPSTDKPSFRRTEELINTARPVVWSTAPVPDIKHTMAIPLNGDFDFLSLLSKLRGRNRNVTLELIT